MYAQHGHEDIPGSEITPATSAALVHEAEARVTTELHKQVRAQALTLLPGLLIDRWLDICRTRTQVLTLPDDPAGLRVEVVVEWRLDPG